jgi:phosphoglycolate phosphatase-like HAD superfamily hydrolase
VRLVLWDVDGTLVRAGGLGSESFQLAITDALQRDLGAGFHQRVRMSGKTDPQIARELLAIAELGDEEVEVALPEVLRRLEHHLAEGEHRMREQGRALPGAAEVLGKLSAADGVVQSVLTGNLAANAVVKLRAFGLDPWIDFDIGAYGSDHHDREELVPIALAKASARYGDGVSAADTWVVGDTPRDLACAQAGGARCALVATGRYRRDELEGIGADVVLDDLSDVDAVVELLG